MRPCDSVCRHALHAMGAGFVLQPGIGAAAFDAGHDFLVAAVLARAGRFDLDPPALAFGVARVHAEQVAGEDRRLVAAGAGAHFQVQVAIVARHRAAPAAPAVRAPAARRRALAAAISSSASSRSSGIAAHRLGGGQVGARPGLVRPARSRPARSCANSRDSARKRSLSATTAGSASRRSSSSRRSASASSLRRRRRASFGRVLVGSGWQELQACASGTGVSRGRGLELGHRRCSARRSRRATGRRRAAGGWSGHGRGIPAPVVRRSPGGQLLARLRQHVRAGALAVRAQAQQRRAGALLACSVSTKRATCSSMIASASAAASRRLRRLSSIARSRSSTVYRNDIGQAGDVGRDVARHRQVQQQHRPVPALRQRGGDLRARQDRLAAGGGARTPCRPRPGGGPARSSGRATPPWRLASSCAWASVRLAISRRLTLACDQVARGQFDGFAGADQQHRGILQAARTSPAPGAPRSRRPRPGWRRCGYRCARAWRRRRPAGTAGPAVRRACPRHRAMRPRPASPGPGSAARPAPASPARWRRGTGGAPHRRRGAGTGRRAGRAPVARMRRQPVGQRLAVVVGHGIQLGAVAGRQQRRLAHLRARRAAPPVPRAARPGKRHPFAQGDRRGLVVDAEDVQFHAGDRFRSVACAKLPAQAAILRPALRCPIGSALPMPMPLRLRPSLLVGRRAVGLHGPGAGSQAASPIQAGQTRWQASMAGEFALQAGKLDEAARRYLRGGAQCRRRCRSGRARHPDRPAGQRRRRCRASASTCGSHRAPQARWPCAGRRGDPGPARRRSGGRAQRELRGCCASGDRRLEAGAGSADRRRGPATQAGRRRCWATWSTTRDPRPSWRPGWRSAGWRSAWNSPRWPSASSKQVVARFPGEPRVALLHASQLREAGKPDEARALLAGLERAAKLIRARCAGRWPANTTPWAIRPRPPRVLALGPQDESQLCAAARLAAGQGRGQGRAGRAVRRMPSAKRPRPDPARRLLLGQIAEVPRALRRGAGTGITACPAARARAGAPAQRQRAVRAGPQATRHSPELHAMQSDAARR